MNQTTVTSYRLIIVLAAFCAVLALFIMAALIISREQVFEYHGSIDTVGEVIIFTGFIVVLAFNITSIIFNALRIKYPNTNAWQNYLMIGLGVLCIIFMLGEKTMADEIARESQLGWEVTGEWIILYVFLTIQLCYNLLFLRQVWRGYQRNLT